MNNRIAGRVPLLRVLSLIIGLSTAAWLGYWAGKQKAVSARKGAFVATLSAAEKLREGKTDAALRVVENHCYSTAVILLNDPGADRDFLVMTLMPDLIKYRTNYARHTSTWTRTEQRLDELLKARQSLFDNVQK